MPKKLTTSEFIEKAKLKHGNKYDYSLVNYINSSSKIKLICLDCGYEFDQLAGNHLKGKGCRNCSLSQINTRKSRCEDFIKKSKILHGDKYDYSLVEYINNKTYVNIICKSCGKIYKTTPDNHLSGSDCRCLQKSKIEKTSLERYGTTNAMLNVHIADKLKNTNIERYGTPYYTSTNDFKLKSKESLMNKYGVDHISKSSFYIENKNIIVDKIQKSLKLRSTYTKSKVEDVFYTKLVSIYGENDVERQYKSIDYPYACDFYVKSRDLYIEFNGHWTHGDCFYSANSEYTNKFLRRLNSNSGNYYRKAKYVFTKLDVEKVSIAKSNNLNYLVFWDNDLNDVDRWIFDGCPIGKDYGVMYSWLEEDSN